ncbi:MAG TPA: DUF4381 domain-containing protein [Gammaproteobacteria bacterium]
MNPIDFNAIPLRDIHLPGAIGWWPPAVGWWILAGVLVAAAVIALIHYRRHYRERAALKALRAVTVALEWGAQPTHCLQQISMILRRFAMSITSRADAVAGLTGERWLEFLDSRWERDAFSAGPGRALASAPYAPPSRAQSRDVVELGALSIDWVNAQRKRKKKDT